MLIVSLLSPYVTVSPASVEPAPCSVSVPERSASSRWRSRQLCSLPVVVVCQSDAPTPLWQCCVNKLLFLSFHVEGQFRRQSMLLSTISERDFSLGRRLKLMAEKCSFIGSDGGLIQTSALMRLLSSKACVELVMNVF